jgi:hypothetical protein
MTPMGKVRTTSRARIAPALLACALLGACAREDGPKVTAVRADEFRDPAKAGAPVLPAGGSQASVPGLRPATPEDMGAGLDNVASMVGAPGSGALQTEVKALSGAVQQAQGETAPIATDARVMADAMVGQINGKPVFASEVLDPLDGRLRALAREVKEPLLFRRRAADLVFNNLRERLRSELVAAEARNRLTPQEREGLVRLLQRLQGFYQSQAGGSLEQARADLQQRTGESSLDRILADERDQILVQRLLNEEVNSKVRVPFTSVERFYEENPDLFNPPGEAVFRVVVIDATEEARAREAAGSASAFEQLARSEVNVFFRDKAGERRLPLSKPISEQELLSIKAVNEAAHRLAPGESAGPLAFTTPSRQVWVRREADDKPPAQSLEEAQVQIAAVLAARKRQIEEGEFITGLLGSGSFSPLDPMTEQLVGLAVDRHLGPGTNAKLPPLIQRK